MQLAGAHVLIAGAPPGNAAGRPLGLLGSCAAAEQVGALRDVTSGQLRSRYEINR